MDPVLLFILILFGILVLYVVIRASQSQDSPDQPILSDDVYEFEGTNNGISTDVQRRVRITAPAQQIAGKLQRIRIDALPLPRLEGLVPPKGKGIDAFVVTVINPRARVIETRQEVNEFAPPLTLTVHYTREDAAATDLNADGSPRLSLVTGYNDGSAWRFERLDTIVQHDASTNSGTLRAQVKTLQPKDPVWVSRP